MIYAIAGQSVVILALLALIHSILRSHASQTASRAIAYEKTLQTMADRIQAPDRLPARDVATFALPEQIDDEWASVGQVSVSDDYGLEDEDG